MISILDRIKSLFGQNKIRLAVIGATSSGKTYLLTDLVTALDNMGYRPEEDEDDDTTHTPITHFIPNVNNLEGVDKTPVYACRPENQYSSAMTNHELGRTFTLDFLDVPGEVITKDSIMEYQAIAKALRNCGSKIFEVTTWRQKGGKGIRRTVKYMKAHHTVDSQDVNDGIVIEGGNMESANSLFGATPSRTQDYVKSAIYIDRLSGGYDKLTKKTRLVSGRYLFDHFYDFVTDTVMEAIVDAWEVIDVDKYPSGSLSVGQTEFGIHSTDSSRDRFDKVYKNHFYFHYYTYQASDVVICDKMAVPSTVGRGDSTDRFNPMMEALKTLAFTKRGRKKHWYLAFRGVDSIIRQTNLQSLFAATDHNSTYSYLMALLSRKTSDAGQVVAGPFGGSQGSTYTFADADTMWDHLSGLEASEQIKDTALEHFTNFDEHQGEYFHDDFEYTIISATSDNDATKLREHIHNRKGIFMSLTSTSKLANDNNARLLQLPPHVYFTASPIAKHFNIFGHKEGNDAKFAGPVGDPSQRLCFGTYQLACDILLSQGKALPFEATEYGSILDYLYGG